MIAELVDGAAGLANLEDPLEQELAGSMFVAMAEDDDVASRFAQELIPAIESRGNDAALTVLTAIGAAAAGGPEPVHRAAAAAADRLAAFPYRPRRCSWCRTRNRMSSASRRRAASTFMANRCSGDAAATRRPGWSKTRGAVESTPGAT